jgi:Putative auto-transporter adhesin, head GIN domain
MIRHLILAPLFLVGACSPGDGRPAGGPQSRTYPLKDFDSVLAETGIRLVLKQGPFAVEAQSRDGDLSRLVVETHGSELSLSSQAMFTLGRSPTYTVTVTAPTYNSIKASAGVSVRGENLKLENIEVDASAGVSVDLSGVCRELTASASAGASINASELKCLTANASAIAGAKVTAYASQKAHGKASAGAAVEFSGNPPMVEKDADIAGVVTVK